MVTIKGIDYDVCIIDGAICLQSLHRDIVFENGYYLLKDEATDLWIKGGRGFGPQDFIEDYVRDNIGAWCLDNLSSGKEVIHYNN